MPVIPRTEQLDFRALLSRRAEIERFGEGRGISAPETGVPGAPLLRTGVVERRIPQASGNFLATIAALV